MKVVKVGSVRYEKYGWFFIFPAVILFLIFAIYPAVESIKLSFQSPFDGVMHYSGLRNFRKMLGDEIFRKSLLNTFLFLAMQVPLMIILALCLSVMLNAKWLRFKSAFRMAVFLPCVTSLVAYSLLFKMMFANEGLVNKALLSIGILSKPVMWFSDPFWARAIIILALTWRWTGYNTIFYLSALQNIPAETFEAAQIDGASTWRTFWSVTLPQLKPIILLTTIMSTNGTLQLFDEPMNITGGGPANATLTISQYIYNQSFVYSPNFGYAATLSYVIVFIMIILAIVQFRVAGDE
jgi:lactose/L-arabinose transport system permease protein